MSKKPKDDKNYLSHMLDEIVRIEQFSRHAEGEIRDYAVARCIEIIGEAAAQISADLKSGVQHIPWRDIVDMRNALIHGYFGVNYDRVWRVVEKDIPLLKEQLTMLLKELD